MNTQTALSLRDISFSFGKNRALQNVSLDVPEGSFQTLLGPSGCGKTTLLRIIAGFLFPDSGTVEIFGRDQNGTPPNRREVGMVFQDYALFPHLTVEKNLLYGLSMKKEPGLSRREKKERDMALVLQNARVLGIANLLNRYPHELSGGQQQRVALGRSLVMQPKILLMDEPLSSLDAKLRGQVRQEIKDFQKQYGITTVYVTHDQDEALSLSDNIAVLDHGKLLQAGSPREIYYSSTSQFVADFVGRSNFYRKGTTVFGVRPEWIRLVEKPIDSISDDRLESRIFEGTVASVTFLGALVQLRVKCDEWNEPVLIQINSTEEEQIEIGQNVYFRILKSTPLG